MAHLPTDVKRTQHAQLKMDGTIGAAVTNGANGAAATKNTGGAAATNGTNGAAATIGTSGAAATIGTNGATAVGGLGGIQTTQQCSWQSNDASRKQLDNKIIFCVMSLHTSTRIIGFCFLNCPLRDGETGTTNK